MWADKTAEEAYDILSQPDVRVTNAKDKEVQVGNDMQCGEIRAYPM